MIESLRNRVRGFLRVRIERARPCRGPKPAIGGHIAFNDFRITVQAGFSDDLWQWLLDQGWRELRYRPEQRRYREVPATCVTELIDAPVEERPLVLDAALERSTVRPILGDPNALPSYVVRH